MFKNFETIHKSKGWAFTDGLLCGLLIAYLVRDYYKSELDAVKPKPHPAWDEPAVKQVVQLQD